MTETQEQAIVDQALLDFKASWTQSPAIAAITGEIGTDQSDDPAVYVVVTLPAETSEDEWSSGQLDPIRHGIKDAIRSAGLERFIYTRFLMQGCEDTSEEEGN
jgi:hypothetical protein